MVHQRSVLLSIALAASAACFAQTANPAPQTNPGAVQSAGIHNADTSDRSTAPDAETVPKPLTPMRRGDILMARKMYREAIETYQEGIRDAAVIYNKIGIGYHQLMDFRTALENYQMALRLDPTYSEAINNIGAVYYAQRNPKKAIREYQRALKHAPRSASIYSNLGTAQFARKKYKDAMLSYQKAVELDPNVFEHRSTSGSLLQERSVEERAKFHYFLAKTYAKAGMVDRAIEYVRKSLEEGFKGKDRYRNEPEFASLQENEEFQLILASEQRVL
jgi:tetratricopeptide (TPR) repeat protein